MNPIIYDNNLDTNNTYRGSFIPKEDILKNLPVKVYIKTRYKTKKAIIIAKTTNYLITKDQDTIYIKDILELKKIA